MKALKIILGLVVAAAIIVAVVVVLVVKNLDGIIKTVVETVGSDVTQVSVTLDAVSTELLAGRIELHSLVIDNPEGFDGAYLFDMDQVALQVEPATLIGKVIVINEVLIDGAKISAELKGQTTNLQALEKNIAQSTSSSTAKPAAETTQNDTEGADVLLMVEKFSFINSNLQLKTDQWGDRTVKMPNILLSDLGDKQSGLTPEQLTQLVISRLSENVQTAVEDEVKNMVKDKAKEQLNKELDERLSDKEKGQLDQLKGMFGQ
tara:strand:- start:516 stop:1301 length:786 start_codon:yes stop_codon:yes gene_type:complete